MFFLPVCNNEVIVCEHVHAFMSMHVCVFVGFGKIVLHTVGPLNENC